MSEHPLVIVGTGPAGLACAEAYRDGGGQRSVVLVGEDPYPPYERPALTKELLRGTKALDDIMRTDRRALAARRIELVPGVRAVDASPTERTVRFDDGTLLEFSDLVLATGAHPAVPGIEGAELTHTVRKIPDSLRLREAAEMADAVVVVGSGFIGCEIAASLARLGTATVTMCTDEDGPLIGRVGGEVSEIVAGWLGDEGVEVRTGVTLEGVERTGDDTLRAQLGDDGVEADEVVLALGIERNLDLAQALGLDLAGDGIATDSAMRTSVDHVHAVGDASAAEHALAGRRIHTEHWGDALAHGSTAGAALAGDETAQWDTVPGFWSTIGDHTLKQVAWGDGFDHAEVEHHGEGAFTARFGSGGVLVGVLCHEADEDYERGRTEIAEGRQWP